MIHEFSFEPDQAQGMSFEELLGEGLNSKVVSRRAQLTLRGQSVTPASGA